jgi:hypothetical protein
MAKLVGLLLVTTLYPLWVARTANRHTSLCHAVHWSIVAWFAWMTTAFAAVLSADVEQIAAYLALCLTGCAGVAVLGARRPGVQAWTFVVLCLLAVLQLPLLEGLDQLRFSPLRALFLCGLLAITVLNYLPTRFGLGAVVLGAGVLPDLLTFLGSKDSLPALEGLKPWGRGLVAAAVWTAWASLKVRRGSITELDQIWLDFRDRYGLVWGQRMRDQFNRSLVNAGWPMYLSWFGFRNRPDAQMPDELQARNLLLTLQALLRRFGPSTHDAG